METFKTTFGEIIKESRQSVGMTQTELAKATKMNRTHLSGIETGKYFPNSIYLSRLIEELHLNPSKIIRMIAAL